MSSQKLQEAPQTSKMHSIHGQGDISNLDGNVEQHARELRRQITGVATPPQSLPFVWGSIRIISVYGSWSWWRNPKRK